MKFIFTLVVLGFFAKMGISQTSGNQQLKYFAQVQLNTTDSNVLNEIETALKSNPNCFVVRLDRITNGLLIVTNELSSFDEVTMTSWFEGNDNVIQCFRIGIQGYDDHFAFDDQFCNKINQ